MQCPRAGNDGELLPPVAQRTEREKLPRPRARDICMHGAACRGWSPWARDTAKP